VNESSAIGGWILGRIKNRKIWKSFTYKEVAMTIHDMYDRIDFETIQRYVKAGQEENLALDFKLLNSSEFTNRDDRKNFAKAISGFANSSGGIVVWGVDCRKNDEGVDCANKIVENENVDILLSRCNELTGTAVSPIVDGVQHKKIYSSTPKGLVVTLVPESDRGPHMAKLGEDRYYKRSGDSFYRMEHFDIADMFGRRRRPNLVLDYMGKRRTRIVIGIRNDGRGIAIAPYLWVKFPPDHGMNPYGSDGNGNWNLPPLISRGLTAFSGTTQQVIHPGTAIDVFVFQRNDNKEVIGPQEIQYGVAAMDVSLREDKLVVD
jgi:hypothetical protein